MDPTYKGALFTAALTLVGVMAKLLWNYIASLQGKIKSLKAQEQLRWENKVDKLELTLATTNAALATVGADVARLAKLASVVEKLDKDITAFHVWRRTKFPDGGGNGSEGETGGAGATVRGREGDISQ